MSQEITNSPNSPQPTDHAGRFQFSLQQLFALVLGVCLVLGVYTWTGACGSLIVLIGIGVIVAVRTKKIRAVEALAVTAVIGLMGACMLPVINNGSRGASRRIQCTNNLKQFGLALHNYHDRYGSFPPAVVYDDRGRPVHSWRVLLLPYLEQQELYEQYRFDEPWDGPNNTKLHSQMPKIFRCPSDERIAPGMTNYLAIIGSGAAWREDGARTLDEFLDGTSNTLLVVETHNSGIGWLEPRDLHVSQMSLTINTKAGQGISSAHVGGAQMLRADGSVHFFSEKTTPAELHALISAAGNDAKDLPRE